MVAKLDWCFSDTGDGAIKTLREHYRCPHFRILIIGRANAGKTTILEKICGVAKGTKPIIYDKNGKPSQNLCIDACSITFRWKTATIWDTFDAINWGESNDKVSTYCLIFSREACMILNIRLHTLDVTLSFMTLKVLNLVQPMSWRLLGNSLKRGQLELS